MGNLDDKEDDNIDILDDASGESSKHPDTGEYDASGESSKRFKYPSDVIGANYSSSEEESEEAVEIRSLKNFPPKLDDDDDKIDPETYEDASEDYNDSLEGTYSDTKKMDSDDYGYHGTYPGIEYWDNLVQLETIMSTLHTRFNCLLTAFDPNPAHTVDQKIARIMGSENKMNINTDTNKQYPKMANFTDHLEKLEVEVRLLQGNFDRLMNALAPIPNYTFEQKIGHITAMNEVTDLAEDYETKKKTK